MGIYILVKKHLHRHQARVERARVEQRLKEQNDIKKIERERGGEKGGAERNFSIRPGCGSCTRAEIQTERRESILSVPCINTATLSL